MVPEVSLGNRVFVTVTTAVMPGAMCALSIQSGRRGNPTGLILIVVISTALVLARRLMAKSADAQKAAHGQVQAATRASHR